MRSVSRDRENSRSEIKTEWYAVYVKHNHERKVADLLSRKGWEIFLPEQKVKRRWKDRNKTVCLPLFPGYLFLAANLQDKFRILNTPGIFFLVENNGRACPISKQEIDSIRLVVQGGVHAEAHPYVREGDRVKICKGPLSGVTGILKDIRNQYRIVLTVEALQKALSIEVEIGDIERTLAASQGSGSLS